MSDGPFKSPLPQDCWRPVLERAENEGFTIEQLQEAIPLALAAECRDLPDGFLDRAKRTLESARQPSLGLPDETNAVDALADAAEGNPLAQILARWVEDALASSITSDDATLDVLTAALRQCWSERARSMEEHAQREATDRHIAPRVRERLNHSAPSDEQLRKVAKGILRVEGESVPRSAPKHTEIEDGPAIESGADET
ncbi:MAG: hypothetical protein K2Y42_20575 [Hyphomicrobium sp.]|uniref:hypothetical protein n=1 Tax=Hyphomicrobium sp. TaxID=82 RepID=UPI0025C13857|nr:hypothetical protein [Hyphomicrobium sp.]MBX9865144.1 hypothetical protein [Hyphomicrobium sp.]